MSNIEIYNQYPQISISGGIHPLSVTPDLSISDTIKFIEDHIHDFVALVKQDWILNMATNMLHYKQIGFMLNWIFAKRCGKPVIIHSRHADDDMLKVVNQYPNVKKVFHCYATNFQFFESLEGGNNYVSFTGMITFSKKGGKVANAVRNVPLNRLMIETDAPYLLPKISILGKIHQNMLGALLIILHYYVTLNV